MGTSPKVRQNALVIAFFVVSGAWVRISHSMAQRVVEKYRNLSCCCSDSLRLPYPRREASEKAPSAVSVRPTVTAAKRNSAAARLLERRVLADSIRLPDILLLGAKESHEVKCFAVGQAERSVPHSPISFRER